MMLISHQEDDRGLKLKQLSFSCIDVTSIATEVLVGAFQMLERVEFVFGIYGNMTAD